MTKGKKERRKERKVSSMLFLATVNFPSLHVSKRSRRIDNKIQGPTAALLSMKIVRSAVTLTIMTSAIITTITILVKKQNPVAALVMTKILTLSVESAVILTIMTSAMITTITTLVIKKGPTAALVITKVLTLLAESAIILTLMTSAIITMTILVKKQDPTAVLVNTKIITLTV